MIIDEFERTIELAYFKRNRVVLEASAMLQIEASELAELLLKNKWYGKIFTKTDLLSEAGDILNFLTYILQEHGLTLAQAMDNNITKLKERGWINE